MKHRFLIIGSGFSGAVLASELAKQLDCHIDIWEEREHAGGNCYTYTDPETGVCVHKYGPHIFNTDRKEIWDYVNSITEFRPYVHRVKAMSNGKVYALPVNLHTINQFFNKTLSPAEAATFVADLTVQSVDVPQNFEEQALKFIGKDLYEAFFYGYTKKQWGCEPRELPASILKRIPVRFNYNDNYHLHIYTGIPVDGYTAMFDKLLDHPSIHVQLNKRFMNTTAETEGYDHVFYTGPIDAYFQYRYGRLGYRTVTFETFRAEGDHQGCTQMNYCDESVPYTRITEHKHFTPWASFDKTICFREFSKETGEDDIPYYPKALAADKEMYGHYRRDAELLSGVSFLGRLATYRYLDMQHVIAEALDYAAVFLQALKEQRPAPVFSNKLF